MLISVHWVVSILIGTSLIVLVESRLVGQNDDFLGIDPDAPGSKGNEFVLGFMGNTATASVETATAALFVTTDDPTGPVPFTVEYLGTSQTGEAIKGSSTLIRLPVGRPGEIGDIRVTGEDERNKGIRVKATDPTKLLTVYGINDADVSTDAFLALPCHAYPYLNYKYFVFSTNTMLSTETFQSRFLIVPCENNTQVTIRPTQQIQANSDLTGLPVPRNVGFNDSITITVNQLQTAQFNSDSDLTGTVIESDKPISVFVGHECGQVPEDMTACDHLVEQMPPDAVWGTQFFTVPLDERESGERYRVGSVIDNNQVTVTCTTEGESRPYVQFTRMLQSAVGQNFLQFNTKGDNISGVTVGYRRDFCCIETTKPAVVMMYSLGHSLDEISDFPGVTGAQGDPFMLLVPPVSQYSNDYTATTAKQVRTDFIGHISYALPIQFFDNSDDSHSRLTINGSVFTPVSGYHPILCSNNQTCGYGAYSIVPVGSHQVLYNMPGAAMNLFVYGFLREISFGYPTGFEMQPIGVPRITIYNITVFENVGIVNITVNRTGGDLSRHSVIFAKSRDIPGQAVAGEDYTPLMMPGSESDDFRIRWLEGDVVNPRYTRLPSDRDPVFQVTIMDDDIPEPPGREYFEIDLTLNLMNNGNGFFYPRAVGRVTIIDDDVPPEIGFDPTSYSYDEATGVARLTITTNMPLRFTDATGALFYTEDGTATGGGVDYMGYTRANAIPITFPPGSFETVIEVPITDDTMVEETERFLGQIVSGGGIGDLIISAPTATVDITDNDEAESVLVTFDRPSYTVSESSPYAVICFNTTAGHADRNITVTIEPRQPSPGGPCTDYPRAIALTDFHNRQLSQTFFASSMGNQLCANIELIGDELYEGNKQFIVVFTNVPDSTNRVGLGAINQTCVTIVDDDEPIFDFENPNITIPEPDGPAQICVTMTGRTTVDITVTASTGPKSGASDRATAVLDYEPRTFMLTFMATDEGTTKLCANVSITDDQLGNEPVETFSVSFASIDPAGQEGSTTETCVFIVDNDVPVVTWDERVVNIPEGGNRQVCFSSDIGTAQSYNVMVGAREKGASPATRDLDYSLPAQSLSVTFSSMNSEQFCIDISTNDDDLGEGTEQFELYFENLPSEFARDGDPNVLCVNILDNESPVVIVERPNVTVPENETDVEVCILLSTGIAQRVIVTAETGLKTGVTDQATANIDYETTTFMLMFEASSDGQRACGRVPIIDDLLEEPNELFSVRITSVSNSNVMIGMNDETCVTIIDDDEPEINIDPPMITVMEPVGMVEICITTDSPLARSIVVTAETGPKSGAANQATADADYRTTTITVTFMPSGVSQRLCGNVSIIDDTTAGEPNEEFSVTLVSSDPPGVRFGDKESCITIIDDDPPTDVLTCRIDEIQQVQPFTRMSDYRFMGTCEYVAVSSCNNIPGFDVRVTVDYISETLENGAVGLHVNNLRYVSREDGSFDDGGQTPLTSSSFEAEYVATGDTRVRVSLGTGQTNITFDSNTPASDLLDTDIYIVHNWGDANPTIFISGRTPNNSAISNFCGLCGSRSGSLLRRDGTEADPTNMAEVQSFVSSYAVPARDQVLRPQRAECGTIQNDTVIGDPLYAAPVYSEDGKEYSLCYEVFGRANSTLNLVTDTCVSVNARYGPMDNPADGNIIRAVGVRAKGLSDSSCHNIRVDLEGCSATVETPDGNSQSLASMERFESDGISVRKYPSRVRISAPNCENVMLVMWVVCENRNNQDMIKFVIARGVNLRPSSHGLLGQFWNIPVTFTRYNGTTLPDGSDASRVYVVTVEPEDAPARSFLGHFYHLKWDKTREPCLYVGNAQGGPSYEVPDPNDSVIEGRYREYIFDGADENLFATGYTYSRFEEDRCN